MPITHNDLRRINNADPAFSTWNDAITYGVWWPKPTFWPPNLAEINSEVTLSVGETYHSASGWVWFYSTGEWREHTAAVVMG